MRLKFVRKFSRMLHKRLGCAVKSMYIKHMVARIRTVAFRGIDVLDIDVEVQIASGLPAFTIAGYTK
ncbi:MAG TPA: hypothetical protein PLK94_07115 [Alphaproteobacteria bacterium]|nr:hypothetical protein [Alphaproteobacteria bacterium]